MSQNKTKSDPERSVQRCVVPLVRCGEYSLERIDGMLFLNHSSGEGMQVDEKRFEAALRKFYKKWF